jgi:hypothetical protein
MTDVSLCPSHMLPLDRRHTWGPFDDVFMCERCESLFRARLASRSRLIPDILKNATNAEALRIICQAFSRRVCPPVESQH